MMKVIGRVMFQRGFFNISNWFSIPTEDAYSPRHLILTDLGDIKDFDKSDKPTPVLMPKHNMAVINAEINLQ